MSRLLRYLETLKPDERWSNGTHNIVWNNGTHAKVVAIRGGMGNVASNATIVSTTAHESPSLVWAGVLLGLVICCTLVLCYLTLPALAVSLHRLVAGRIATSTSRVQRRYETIEGWLISKRVRAHCSTCDQIQNQFGKKLPTIKLTTSHDTAETVLIADPHSDDASLDSNNSQKGHECSVCMERFKENDIVSWSPCLGCDHVFHHVCLKQWLLYHEDCPYCRVTVLPVDREATDDIRDDTPTDSSSQRTALSEQRNPTADPSWLNLTRKQWTVAQLKQLAELRTRRVLSTYYCLREGLVTLAEPPHSMGGSTDLGDLFASKKTLLSIQRYVSTGVPQSKLAEMRESKHCCGCTNDEVVVTVVPADSNTVDTDNIATDNDGFPASSASASPHQADAAVDVELCLSHRQVISNNDSVGEATPTR